MMRNRFAVALLIESSNAYARELLRGISCYVHETSSWSVTLHDNEPGFERLAWFKRWKGDGVIARIEDARLARQLKSVRVPIINVSGAYHMNRISHVCQDDQLIARLGIEHLRECGFHRVAYCGDDRFAWSRNRSRCFQEYARQSGLECFLYDSRKSRGGSWLKVSKDLRAWLESLVPPIGIMASHDFRGQQVIEICKTAAIAVPEQVAVLGADNDELICNFCEPRMSSIIVDAFQAGYQAATLLDAKMLNPSSPLELIRIPPRGVEIRQSTDVVAVKDQRLARALRMIRHQACEGISVSDVVRDSGVSRGTLEGCFRRSLARSIHAEIERVRVNQIKHLLTNTESSLEQIAVAAGFRHPEYMHVSFKRAAGISPGQYRTAQKKRN